jgi:NADPH:quinone reductase-like Zn-dependent oxidoreductase
MKECAMAEAANAVETQAGATQAGTTNAAKANVGWAIDAYGDEPTLHTLPMPVPGDGDILIAMRGAEVGDWDELVRTGGWPMERPFPLVLGLAGAGRVAALGRAVTGFQIGDPVYAYSYPLFDNGAWAEYMLVPQAYAARPPAAMPLVLAGALPIVGLTAHECLLDVLQLKKGESILITAASGGVGHLAVQIAARLGAHVVATARALNHEFVSGLGAELVIDYSKEDVVAAVRARYPAGVDKVLSGVSGPDANQALRAVRNGGMVVDLPGAITGSRPGVRLVSDYVVRGDGARLAQVSALIGQGVRLQVQPPIAFERAPQALELVLGKHVVGKLVLEVEEQPLDKSLRTDGSTCET